LLASDGVGEGRSGTILVSVDELANTMTKELVARNMHFIGFDGILSQDGTLLFRSELHGVHGVATHRIVKEHVLEAFVIPDVIVVGDINSERATVSGKRNDVKRGEVGSQERVLLHLTGPWQLRDNLLGGNHEVAELLRLLFIDDSDPALKVAASVLWIDVGLNPAHVGLNDGPDILDPGSLRVLVSGD